MLEIASQNSIRSILEYAVQNNTNNLGNIIKIQVP